MRIKVVSDGTRGGTKILDADTGESIDALRVIGINWEVPDRDGHPVLTLRCQGAEVEIEGEADKP